MMSEKHPEEIAKYASVTDYTEEQIAQMTEKQFALLKEVYQYGNLRHGWRDSVGETALFKPGPLVAYVVLVAIVWWRLQAPPVTMLLIGVGLLVLMVAVRLLSGKRKRDENGS